MNRKVTVVGGAGNVGSTVARCHRRQGTGRCRGRRHRRSEGGGHRARHARVVPDYRIRQPHHRRRGLRADGQFRRRGDHLGRAAQAGHEPRRPAERQLRDHEGGHRAGHQVLAELHHRSGRQSARRDVPGGLPPERLSARARHRHGRGARLGPDAHVHRDGAERLGRKRPRLRPRRPRRHHGAAAALLDGRRRADHRADVQRSGSRRSASAPPMAAPKSPSWSAPVPGTRRARPRPKWSKPSSRTRRRFCPARSSCRANTASTICSSACRSSWARAGSNRSSRSR